MNTTNTTEKTMAKPGASAYRKAVTPLLISLFAVSALTGILLAVHIKSVSDLHLWTSLVFVAIAGAHSARNWGALVAQFRNWPVWAGLSVAVIAVAVFLFAAPEHGEHGGHHGPPGGPNFESSQDSAER
jgi:hypothetical protein